MVKYKVFKVEYYDAEDINDLEKKVNANYFYDEDDWTYEEGEKW